MSEETEKHRKLATISMHYDLGDRPDERGR